jgi:hypothetical protein
MMNTGGKNSGNPVYLYIKAVDKATESITLMSPLPNPLIK